MSPSVHPKAELALAALQMRLRARCTKGGRKEGPKEDLAAAAFIFELIFLLRLRPSLSLSHMHCGPSESAREERGERRAHLAHSLLGLPRANVASSSSAQRNLVSTHSSDYVAAVPRECQARPGPSHNSRASARLHYPQQR